MSENTENKREYQEYPGGQFKEGNPGRPKGAKSFTTKVRDALEKIAEGKDYTYEEAFIKSILKKAIVDGDSSIQKLVWNYLDGMPVQKVEMKGEINNPYDNLTPEQKRARIRRSLETGGDDGGPEQPDILDGGDSGISQNGTSPQADRAILKEAEQEENLIDPAQSLENNGSNDKLLDTADNQQS